MEKPSERPNTFTYWRYGENIMEPIGPIGIIAQQMDPIFSDEVNRKLRQRRTTSVDEHAELQKYIGYLRPDYRIDVDLGRFKTGEGRAEILESVRGHDLYIITDVLNDAIYMNRFNQTISLSPDDHYQDLVRIITATHGICKRVNVIMPYLHEGRRHNMKDRVSLDCAVVLRYLFSLGISNFITFDANDGRVANAVPRNNFENFPTFLPVIKKLLTTIPDLKLAKDTFMVISPHITDINRAIYYATLMKVPLGTFYEIYKAGGQKEFDFLGDPVKGRDIIMISDIINTGNDLIRHAWKLKEQGAERIFILSSFALFTDGYEKMNQAYDFGVIDKVFATNLTRIPRPVIDAPWFEPVDMTGNISMVIDALNHNASLSSLFAPSDDIHELISAYRKHQSHAKHKGVSHE